MAESPSWLVADVGGTNTRCGIGPAGGQPRRLVRFPNAGHASLAAILEKFLGELPPAERPDRALLAVAAPVTGEEVRMLNIRWSFTAAALRDQLGLRHLGLVNDFAALARALPHLEPAELTSVGGGAARSRAPRVVLGPGTGLGTAGLVPLPDGGWQAVSAEGGHVTLAAMDEEEEAVIRAARERFGHCSAERLVSGPGFSLLHELRHGETLAPEELTRRAAAGEGRARSTLAMGFRFLGTVAANLALSFGALGGVYIGGGIVPRNLAFFRESGFRERFEDKGRYREYLAAIPVQVITAPAPALTGLLALAADPATG